LFVKVNSHTNLRKTPSLQGKSQGVVEKCTKLKLTGHRGIDDAEVSWLGVCYKGKKLFVCTEFLKHYSGRNALAVKFYDKDGNLFFLSGIRDILHHILHAAVQDFAEHINGVDTDKFVALQAGDLTGNDAVLSSLCIPI